MLARNDAEALFLEDVFDDAVDEFGELDPLRGVLIKISK